MQFIKNLNACTTTENKSGDTKDSFYEELVQLFTFLSTTWKFC